MGDTFTAILTEKPSVAREFAAAIGASKRGAFYANANTLVLHAVGHLLELYEPQDYSPEFKKWRTEDIPIVPSVVQWKPISSHKDHLSSLRSALQAHSIAEVVVATDAGREGELIGRLILDFCEKELAGARRSRFWSSEALTQDAIMKGLQNRVALAKYDRLYQAGMSRAVSDWIVGINLSRLYSLLLDGRFSVGRVQTTILRIVSKQCSEIASFEKTPFWEISVLGQSQSSEAWFSLKGDGEDPHRFLSHEEGNRVAEEIAQQGPGVVTEASAEQTREAPPQLLNLSGLQQSANKQAGLSAKQTLQAAQSLYETHKVLSYPRTPSRVMGNSDVDYVRGLVDKFSSYKPDLWKTIDEGRISESNTRVFNDAKLEDHHALVPLGPCPENATVHEKTVHDIVCSYFAAALSIAAVWDREQTSMRIGDRAFQSKEKRLTTEGWRRCFGQEEDRTPLPRFTEGESIRIKDISLMEKETSPPKHYTESSLLAVMEKPGRLIRSEAETFPEGSGLGTAATRAAIIEGLLEKQLLSRKGKSLKSTPKGDFLVAAIDKSPRVSSFTEPLSTARLEQELTVEPQRVVERVAQEILQVCDEVKNSALSRFEDESRTAVGVCPYCGGEVKQGPKAFFCENIRNEACNLVIYRKITGASISRSTAAILLSGKQTAALQFKSKAGKKFQARLELKEGKVTMEFVNKTPRRRQKVNHTGKQAEQRIDQQRMP